MPKLLTFSELRDAGVLYTRRHVDRLEAEGKFPKRVTIGEARVGWVAQEVRDWIDKRIRAREQA
jgi:prophage regulatory protein